MTIKEITNTPVGNATYGTQNTCPIEKLPFDVLGNIFRFLNVHEIGSCFQVCKGWKSLSNNNFLWNQLLSRDFFKMKDGDSKSTYQRNYMVNSNLTKGVYSLKSLEEHNGNIITMITSQNQLISGSFDNTIKIWDLESNQSIQTFEGHLKAVNLLHAIEGKLYSRSSDNTMMVWDLTEKKCVGKFKTQSLSNLPILFADHKHFGVSSMGIEIWDLDKKTKLATLQAKSTNFQDLENTALRLLCVEEKLFASYRDNSVRIWDLSTNTCVGILEGHTAKITHLSYSNGRLFSAASDNSIKIWDSQKHTCLSTLATPSAVSTPLLMHNNLLIAGCSDLKIRIWDLNTLECIDTLEGHIGDPFSIMIVDQKLISSSADRTIKVWDLNSRMCTTTLKGHSDGITQMKFENDKLMTASYDKTIKIWNFNASDIAIFKQLADDFTDPAKFRITMDRFSRMPEKKRKEIYKELCLLLQPISEEYPDCDNEDAFHDQNGRSSTPQQKAEAILHYLNQIGSDQSRLSGS